ncbi:hypothetical protein ALC57_07058, partial [Trachymyrmex cornetzi]
IKYYRRYHVTLLLNRIIALPNHPAPFAIGNYSLSAVPLAATSFNLLSRIQTTWETALVVTFSCRISIISHISISPIYKNIRFIFEFLWYYSGVPFREFRKTQEAIIPRRKNILLGHTEENSLAHHFSANEGNLEALDTSRLTYEGCSAAKLTEEQQTFVDSTTFYSSTYPCGRDRSRYRNDISWPAFAAADDGNTRVARWRDKKVG